MKKSIFILSMIALGLAAVTSCNKEAYSTGSIIRFGVSTTYNNGPATKTTYTGEDGDGLTITSTSQIERIDWLDTDQIRIACAQATVDGSEDKFADYKVTPVTGDNNAYKATISPATGNGLEWGEGNHTFFAVYPSAGQNSAANVTLSTDGTKATIYGSIPVEQTVTLDAATRTFKPDMDYAYMYAVETGVAAGSDVMLDFKPLVTAVEFKLLTKAGDEIESKLTGLTLTMLQSSRESQLTGDFATEVSSTGVYAPLIAGRNLANPGHTINITLPGEGVMLSSAPAEAYTVTFLCLPCDLSALQLLMSFADGSKRRILLDRTDELDGFITIPACKKTYIWNLAAPSMIPYSNTNIAPVVGQYTVNAEGKKVGFAPANVKYTGSGSSNPGTWSVMPYPWAIVEEDGTMVEDYGHSATSKEEIGLFGWATSGVDDGSRPWRTDQGTYGPDSDLTGENYKYDWGSNTFDNLVGSGWRTPSYDEWIYVLQTRVTDDIVDHAYTYATVEGMQGAVLFPDGYVFDASPSPYEFTWVDYSFWAYYDDNVITAKEWFVLQALGCVFLPAAGIRTTDEGKIEGVHSQLFYWSSTHSTTGAWEMHLEEGNNLPAPSAGQGYRAWGQSVRLVKENINQATTLPGQEVGGVYDASGSGFSHIWR